MLKGSFVFIALCFVLIQFSSGVHGDPDPCAAFNASCAVCTAQPTCGWCGPVATCMSGNKQGPTSLKCYGDSWFFGTTNLNGNNPCPDCNAITTCKECLYFDADCLWCASSGKCKENGNWLGCTGVNTCPCDIYGSCSDCVKDPQCLWCGGSNQTCVGINDACVQPAHTCPCADNLDCRSCFDDSNQGCVWCQQEGVGTCTSTPDPTCGIAMNCNTYCSTNGPTCTTCNELNSCAWCESLGKCVDSTSPVCSFFQHTCPDCSSHRFCDTCQDAGCSWCRNGECRATGDLAGCDIIGTGQCDQYCAYFSDCNGCNVLPGCAWCEDSNSCVDSDSATCFIAHSCSDAKTSCGFDGGAFVGGMFLGIGLVAIGLGGFLFYRWKTGTKYTEPNFVMF